MYPVYGYGGLTDEQVSEALVDRYPKAERARGFLIAKGMDDDG